MISFIFPVGLVTVAIILTLLAFRKHRCIQCKKNITNENKIEGQYICANCYAKQVAPEYYKHE